MSVRPEPGTRVVLPTGSFEQECIVLDPSEDRYGMVAVKTTRRYSTRDAWGFRVYHKKGEKAYYKHPGYPEGDDV